MAITNMFCIIRPNASGVWYVQNDVDHAPHPGISTTLDQTANYVRVLTSLPFTKVGAVQISSDDDWGPRVSGHAGAGLNGIAIQVFVDGVKINPAHIWNYVPNNGGGNFWISWTMQ